ncbi:MAG: hypothetical protein B6D41_06120 [Chloroflexi bacterium UTCFX4]|nr:MAG: hypothetical protein B6D41_06120 [Chloroflexi bacterium UTCFX4]
MSAVAGTALKKAKRFKCFAETGIFWGVVFLIFADSYTMPLFAELVKHFRVMRHWTQFTWRVSPTSVWKTRQRERQSAANQAHSQAQTGMRKRLQRRFALLLTRIKFARKLTPKVKCAKTSAETFHAFVDAN